MQKSGLAGRQETLACGGFNYSVYIVLYRTQNCYVYVIEILINGKCITTSLVILFFSGNIDWIYNDKDWIRKNISDCPCLYI